MCRNIRTLYNFEPPATDDEIRAAALQFVRKVSGYTKPSVANQAAFDEAVDEGLTGRTLVAEYRQRAVAELVGDHLDAVVEACRRPDGVGEHHGARHVVAVVAGPLELCFDLGGQRFYSRVIHQ